MYSTGLSALRSPQAFLTFEQVRCGSDFQMSFLMSSLKDITKIPRDIFGEGDRLCFYNHLPYDDLGLRECRES